MENAQKSIKTDYLNQSVSLRKMEDEEKKVKMTANLELKSEKGEGRGAARLLQEEAPTESRRGRGSDGDHRPGTLRDGKESLRRREEESVKGFFHL